MFVVANSLAVSNKAESATKHYNLRVVECRWVPWGRGRAQVGVVQCMGVMLSVAFAWRSAGWVRVGRRWGPGVL